MPRRPIPIDNIIVTTDKIYDRIYEAAENTHLDPDAILRALALARPDTERLLEILCEKILKHNRL